MASSQKPKANRRSALNLTDWVRHWFLKLLNHLAWQGFCLSKTLSFLSFQSSQAAMRKASAKKGMLCTLLAWKILSIRLRLMSQEKPMVLQHCTTKGQVKNRWSMVSSELVLQRTQRSSLCTKICLLVSMDFVLSRSTATNQAKNFILAVHFDFQNSLKIGWASTAL